MNVEQGMQVVDIFGVVRRRGKSTAIVAGIVMLLTYWVVMALPNLYTSSSMILVEPQSVADTLVDSGVRESDLSERLGLMTAEILSRSRLSEIITDFSLYEDEHDDMQRFEVVELMKSYVDVVPVLSEIEDQGRNKNIKFNTFRIVFTHEDPLIAQAVAQRIANDFINANIESRTAITAKSLEFMGDEIGSLTSQLAEIEKAISAVKGANPGRLPEELDSNQRSLQFALNDLRDAQRIFDTARNDAAYWKNQALTASEMATPNDPTNPTNRLRSLEIERGSLLARGYTSKHPDMVRVETEMAILSEQIRGDAEGDGARSLPEQNAMAEQGRADLRAEAAQEDIGRLKANIEDLELRLAETPAVAEELDALNRQYDHLYRSYQDFSNRLQQAGVQADLERRQLGERFRILEPAERAPEPSSPNRFLLLTLGSILGIAIGVGMGLIAEVTDTSIHTSTDLQTKLGIPVLVSVPRIMLESDRVARSRRILRESLAAAGVVLFVILGGIATYVVVNGNFSDEGSEQEAAEDVRNEARRGFGTGIGRG